MNQLNCELKQQIIEYFDTLQNKLNNVGFSDKRVILPDNIQKAFKYITRVLDQFIEQIVKLTRMNQEMTQQYELLEQNLQKIESENRYHIHVEQRLKIHCDQLQEMVDEKTDLCKTLQMKLDLQERQILQLRREIDIATKRRIDTEKSVTDSQSRFLLINGVSSQSNVKQILKPKSRFVTEALEINKVRSISTIDYSNHSILLRRNDERNKRSSTIQMLKKK